MTINFEELQKRVRLLEPREKAALARRLIEDLNQSADEDAAVAWEAVATDRHEAHQAGESTLVPSQEAMERARRLLK